MKNVKILLFLLLFATFEKMYADSVPAQKDGFTTIVNKSNMPIYVAYNYQDPKYAWSSIITPGQTGTIAFSVGDTIRQVTIYYAATPTAVEAFNKGAAGVDAATTKDIDGVIRFVPVQIENCSLYVYGNNQVKVGDVDKITDVNNPAFARYAAWWSGDIPGAKDMTVDVAKASSTVQGLLTMHVANINGLIDTDPTVQAAF